MLSHDWEEENDNDDFSPTASKRSYDDEFGSAGVAGEGRNTKACHSPFAAALPAPATQLLSHELLMKIASFTGEWSSFRSCAVAARDAADQSLSSLRALAAAPKSILMGLLRRLKGLQRLHLSHVAAVDDDVIALAVSGCGLTYLDISFCHGVSMEVVALLARVATVVARGCWRLLTPSPSLTSEAAMELQLLALQMNDPEVDDGVAKHFAFFARAPAGFAEFRSMAMRGLQPLLNCVAFSSRRLDIGTTTSRQASCYLVRVLTPCETVHDFLWIMSKHLRRRMTTTTMGEGKGEEEGDWCWMTDAIMAAEHGLLAFLHLDAIATTTTTTTTSSGAVMTTSIAA